jgi:hypothetical protein
MGHFPVRKLLVYRRVDETRNTRESMNESLMESSVRHHPRPEAESQQNATCLEAPLTLDNRH